MAIVRYASKLKLGDIISYIDINWARKPKLGYITSSTDKDYVCPSIVIKECMLVERERCDDYTQYKFLVIESDCEYRDGTYIYLRYPDKNSEILFLYNVKEIIGCHSAIHR